MIETTLPLVPALCGTDLAPDPALLLELSATLRLENAALQEPIVVRLTNWAVKASWLQAVRRTRGRARH